MYVCFTPRCLKHKDPLHVRQPVFKTKPGLNSCGVSVQVICNMQLYACCMVGNDDACEMHAVLCQTMLCNCNA